MGKLTDILDVHLVTHHGRRPFNMPHECPICGGAMKMKSTNDGTCREDPRYFEFVCTCCKAEIIAEGDVV
jgi:hypothetical protein